MVVWQHLHYLLRLVQEEEHEIAVAISATVSGVTDTVDWKIGASDGSSDNKLQGDGIILVLEETVTDALAGVLLVSGTTRELSSTHD